MITNEKKFLVLGSNSFSGSSFVSYLVRQEDVKFVIGVSRSCESDAVFLPYKFDLEAKDKFLFQQFDLNSSIQEIIEIIKKHKITHIVNFAAQGMVAQSWENPDQWFSTNALSLSYLLKELHKLEQIESFVQASTPEVYGVCNNMSESYIYKPSTPYAASKAAADCLLYAYYKTYGFPVRYTRSANVYGAGQQLYRIIPKTIITVLNKSKLYLHGAGVSLRSFVHIKDVCEATYRVACLGRDGEIYHISNSTLTSIRELVYLICGKMNVEPEEYVLQSEQRVGADSLYFLNSEKINHELNWQSKISLEQGLEEVILWAKINFETLKHVPSEYIHKE